MAPSRLNPGKPLEKHLSTESFRLSELVERFLAATNDPRKVVGDAQSRYFGLQIDDRSLTPAGNPRLGKMRFAEWLSSSGLKN